MREFGGKRRVSERLGEPSFCSLSVLITVLLAAISPISFLSLLSNFPVFVRVGVRRVPLASTAGVCRVLETIRHQNEVQISPREGPCFPANLNDIFGDQISVP